MKLKLTILSLILSIAVTSVQAAVSLTDVYKFDNNLTSKNGHTMQGQLASVTYAGGSAIMHANGSGIGGYYLNSAAYNLTDNWAVQMDIKFLNTTGTAAKIFASNNNTGNGLCLAATNGVSGSSFALCSGNGWNGFSNATIATTPNLQSASDMVKLSIVNQGGKLYMFAGNTQLSFGNGRDFLTLAEAGISGGTAALDRFMLGFGPQGQLGMASGNDLTVGNLNVYSFASTDSLGDVKAAMGIPEPVTASLALLGFAAFGLRRRRSL